MPDESKQLLERLRERSGWAKSPDESRAFAEAADLIERQAAVLGALPELVEFLKEAQADCEKVGTVKRHTTLSLRPADYFFWRKQIEAALQHAQEQVGDSK